MSLRWISDRYPILYKPCFVFLAVIFTTQTSIYRLLLSIKPWSYHIISYTHSLSWYFHASDAWIQKVSEWFSLMVFLGQWKSGFRKVLKWLHKFTQNTNSIWMNHLIFCLHIHNWCELPWYLHWINKEFKSSIIAQAIYICHKIFSKIYITAKPSNTFVSANDWSKTADINSSCAEPKIFQEKLSIPWLLMAWLLPLPGHQ